MTAILPQPQCVKSVNIVCNSFQQRSCFDSLQNNHLKTFRRKRGLIWTVEVVAWQRTARHLLSLIHTFWRFIFKLDMLRLQLVQIILMLSILHREGGVIGSPKPCLMDKHGANYRFVINGVLPIVNYLEKGGLTAIAEQIGYYFTKT